MAKTISKNIYVKDSEVNPSSNTPLRDKTFGFDPYIRFYALEDVDETEKGEEAEIFVVYDSRFTASRQNLVKRHFPYINMFYHEGPIVINSMRYLTIRVFDHLEITSPMDVKKSLAYTQRILGGAALKKHQEVLVTFRQSVKELAGDDWTLGEMTRLAAE